jgi:DNA-binding transcriptional ArsR family regulator
VDEIDYRLSEIYNVLGNGLRLWIVKLLSGGSMSVTELSNEMDRPIETVSGHLKKLRDQELIQAESDGRRRSYELKRPDLIEHCLELCSFISREDME